MTNVAVVLLSLYVAVELINKLYKEGNVLAFDNRRTLAYIIGLTGGIAAVAVNPWDFRMHVTILELYNEVVNNYNFNAEDKLERKLRRIYNLMLTLFVGKLGGIVGYFLCDILARGADDYVDKMCLLLSFFYTLAIVQPAVGAASFYTYILLYAGEQIQKVFRWRIHDGNLETDRFVSQLGLFVMLQKRCQFSMRLYMKSLSRYMPICLTTIFFFCIIQFSLAVEMVMNADLKDEQIRGACAMLVGGLAAMSNMLFLMVYIDSSRNSVGVSSIFIIGSGSHQLILFFGCNGKLFKVNNVISFINRFPTANLSPREISMVR